ncbi:MAG: UDP-glucose/GDP-mannose dehydrogenase family protein [Parvibaculum sp.]
MRLAMIGTGYVGLVTGACFADLGHEIVCIDNDEAKLARLAAGEIPIYEPGLEELVKKNVAVGRLSFSNWSGADIADCDAAFIAVGTPPSIADGSADLSAVYAVAAELAPRLRGYTVIVNKSTVPVGTGDEVEAIIARENQQADFDVASNPEFLREGSAIDDFMKPDRVVVGTESERAEAVMRAIYRPLGLSETPIVMTGRTTSELIKYAANAFLATKVTFINEIADICEATGANVQDVSKGIGLDTRIGQKFLQAGAGFGGSCFPKDSLALVDTARKVGRPTQIVEAVIAANTERKRRMADKIVQACGGSVEGQTLAVLGLTFKPNTDDMRDAPSLDIIPLLQEAGAVIRAYDPEGMEQAARLLTDIDWGKDPYSVMKGASALLIFTEWNDFRLLDMQRIKSLLTRPLIVDLRNIYTLSEMKDAGIVYYSVGRPAVG